MSDDSLAFKNFSVRVDEVPLKANGRYYDYVQHNFDLTLTSNNADLKKIVRLFPATANLDLTGKADAKVTAQGALADLKANGQVNISQGMFYGQPIAGQADLVYAKRQLSISLPNFQAYRGWLKGKCNFDFAPATPELSLKLRLNQLDLGAMVQDAPGIVGQATGELNLYGPLTRLNGEISANLTQASFVGQPMDNIFAVLAISDGDVHLETLSVRSETASLHSSGSITSDLNFDFQAQAQGIKLSGQGLIGEMKATVDSFQGTIGWKLDDKFLASPLKNLNAAGQVKLSQGQIGEQYFDLAQGQFSMGQGLISIDQVIFGQGQSVLQASGQTGLGQSTNLTLSGSKIDLNDLKILNYVLPKEAKNPVGLLDLSLEITGEMSKEVSFEELLGLNAAGAVTITKTRVAEISIKQAKLKLLWSDRKLGFPQGSLKTDRSDVTLSLVHQPNDQITGKINGVLDLDEFKLLTHKYGKLEGLIGLNLIIEGPLTDPPLAASFWLENFRFNSLNFDRVAGSATLAQDIVELPQPLLVVKNNSQYAITGLANLASIAKGKPEDIYLDLKIDVSQADLAQTITLSEKIQGEFARKAFETTVSGKTSIDAAAIKLPSVRHYLDRGIIRLYSSQSQTPTFLNAWAKLNEQLRQHLAQETEWNLGGELTGRLTLQGKVKKLSGGFSGEVKKGRYRDFEFDKLNAKASLANNQIKLDKFEINKERGKLTAKGEINFDNTVDLDLTAQNMPLDVLRILFKKEFDGNFNMNASVNGPLDNLTISAAVAGNNVKLAQVPFDRVTMQVSKRDNLIQIHELSLLDNQNLSKVSGWLDLSANGQIDLKAQLQDNGVGLFNLITDDVKWRQGKARASLEVSGSMAELKINGSVVLADSTVYVRVIDSEIKDISGEALVRNSLADIKNLTGIWKGKSSKNYLNPLGLAGTVDLKYILADPRRVDLNLAFSPTWILVNLPNLFSGTVKINQASLTGPLYFDFSQGPTLSGEAQVDNAVITLARGQGSNKKVFPLNFDLKVNLDKNVYAVMGNVATLDLSNIFMNLEINSPELIITGSMKYPSLLGKIFLKRGTVTIFNREFSLLNMEQQEKFFPFNAEKVLANTAAFVGAEGMEGTQPDVAIVAKVEVENQEKEGDELVTKKVIILSRLNGVIGTTEKGRGLNISFDSFSEDKSKTPTELTPAGYSEEEIKVMLLPDFIKSLAGIGQGDESSDVDTNAVVADYISSRLQTVVFRGLERELEQTLGLESLILEYNFGKEVREAMGVEEARTLEGDKPDWRVGFVKGLFDRLYLEVNYSQYGAEAENPMEEVFDYQLTYKLSSIWSIIYYREPTSPQELTTGYQKVTLKAGFSFW